MIIGPAKRLRDNLPLQVLTYRESIRPRQSAGTCSGTPARGRACIPTKRHLFCPPMPVKFAARVRTEDFEIALRKIPLVIHEIQDEIARAGGAGSSKLYLPTE